MFAIPGSRDSGSRPFSPIPIPGIGRVSIPGLRDYKNSSNNIFTNNNSSPSMNKIFEAHYRVLLLLCIVICVITVTLHSQYFPYDSAYILMHEISLLWIKKQRPFCKPNLETESWDPGITNMSIPDPGIENSIPDCNHYL